MIARLALALALTAGTATAQTTQFDGDWATGDPNACDVGEETLNFAWHIGDGRVYGVESACEMTNPVGVTGLNATLFDMQCMGEGEEWSDRMMLMIDPDGALVMVGPYGADVHPRCVGSDAAAPQK